MKETEIDKLDPQLDRLLHEWKVDEPLPPRFNANVWRRIESREVPGMMLKGAHWFDSLARLLARPAFATAVATLLLLAGLAAGLWRADQDAARWESNLAERYMASVNPYAAERP